MRNPFGSISDPSPRRNRPVGRELPRSRGIALRTLDQRGRAASETEAEWEDSSFLDEQALSSFARDRRAHFYRAQLALCIIPFLAPLVYYCQCRWLMSRWTDGETDRVSRQQRHRLGVVTVVATLT